MPLLDCGKADELVGMFKEAEQCLARVLTEPPSMGTQEAYFRFCEVMEHHINFFSIRDIKVLLDQVSFPLFFTRDEECEVPSVGCRADQAAAAFECVRVYLNNLLHFSTYSKGIQDLRTDGRNISKLYLTENADNNIRRNLVALSPNAPDWVYNPDA